MLNAHPRPPIAEVAVLCADARLDAARIVGRQTDPAQHHEHCRLCAEQCRRCERTCAELLAALTSV